MIFFLERRRGRPRKDGTRPVRPRSPTLETNLEEEEARTQGSPDLLLLYFIGKQKVEIRRRLGLMERHSTKELCFEFGRELHQMESIWQRIKGEQFQDALSGKMNMGLYVLQEAVKLLKNRAEKTGDVGFLKSRMEDMEKKNLGLRAENERQKRKLLRDQRDMASLRENIRPIRDYARTATFLSVVRDGEEQPMKVVVEILGSLSTTVTGVRKVT